MWSDFIVVPWSEMFFGKLSQCKRITDISDYTLSLEVHQRSHWEFILEEMAWLANDYA